MPLIPVFSAVTGAIVGWCVNDAADEAKSVANAATETVKNGFSAGSLAIAGVLAFIVLKKIKAI